MTGFFGTVAFMTAVALIACALLPEWLAMLTCFPLAWLVVEFTT